MSLKNETPWSNTVGTGEYIEYCEENSIEERKEEKLSLKKEICIKEEQPMLKVIVEKHGMESPDI